MNICLSDQTDLGMNIGIVSNTLLQCLDSDLTVLATGHIGKNGQ